MQYFDIKSGEWVEEECVEENGFVVNTKGELVKYKDFDNHVIIPREVKGIPITSIGDGMIYFMGGYAFEFPIIFTPSGII